VTTVKKKVPPGTMARRKLGMQIMLHEFIGRHSRPYHYHESAYREFVFRVAADPRSRLA
jgi:hypothetical protein